MSKKKGKYDNLDNSIVDLKNFAMEEKAVSTGSLMFDWFLDGGFKSGLYRFGGSPEKGKTAQALTWAAEWLKSHENGRVVYFDTECRITPFKLNASPLVDVKDYFSRVELYQSNIYEEIAEKMYEFIRDNDNGYKYFFVIDSLDMMLSIKDLNYNFDEDEKMASIAKLTKRLMRRSGPFLRKNGHHLHVLSQITANLGATYGPTAKSDFGGYSIQHSTDLWGSITDIYSTDIIWEFPDASKKEDKGRVLGHYFKVKFDKTPNEKTGQSIRVPIKRAWDNGKSGVWKSREVVDLMLMFDMFSKSGAWFEIKSEHDDDILDVKKWQGQKNLYAYFDENESVLNRYEQKLRSILL